MPGDAVESWDLTDLYPDDRSFDRARRALKRRLPELGKLRGTLGRAAVDLRRALDTCADAGKELNRLHAYASMRADSDTRAAAGQAMREQVELLWTEFSRVSAFLRPEILALDPEQVRGFLEQEPGLAPHGHFLEDLLRQRAHVLGPEEERILAEASLLGGGPNAVFNLLHNAELPRPELTLSSGETVRLTPAEFHRHRTTPLRDDRRRMYAAFFGAYADFRDTLGQNLFQGIKVHVFRSRARRYESCLAAALDGENIPTAVYHNLIRQVGEGLPLLHRYFRLRARALEVERLEYHDLHCPLAPEARTRYEVEAARELMRRSLAPLGEEYGGALERALRERWIDWHPRPGKRSGAYASGAAYDVHPYILLNFTNDYDSVSTLSHELGHALHSYFSNREQPFPTSSYSIFVAEVASTFNEALLNARMLDEAGSDTARLTLLTEYLDGLRATLFRQTMFAEFELDIHQRAERGEPLTGESLDELYLAHVRRYHGHDDDVVHVGDAYAVEWAAIPHFHYNFYVYQYATGIVAATALARAVLRGETGARERYLQFLSSGGADYSLELLRRAGVDLERPAPYQATLRVFEECLDRLQTLLDRATGTS